MDRFLVALSIPDVGPATARLLQPTLNRLAAQTREPLSAVVRDGDEVVIVARSASVGGQRLMAYGLHLGARLPLHATSTGRVLLAALPRAFATWA